MNSTGKMFKAVLGGGLSLLLIFTLVGQAVAQCVPPPPGLVSWWPLDETSGTTAADIEDANPGTHFNGPTPVAGKVAGALSFDGVDDYVDVLSPTGLPTGAAPRTVAYWAKADIQSGTQKTMFVYGDNALRDGFFTFANFLDADTVAFSGVGPFNVTSTKNIQDNLYHFLTFTYDGSDVKIYVDGLDVTDLNNSDSGFALTTTQNNVRIGGHLNLDVGTFKGEIDEVQIFNRVLSATEIQAEYNAGSAGKCKVPTVAIDIKPGSDPNCFNVNGHGVIPVAILGDADFDVSNIDVNSLSFAGLGVRARGNRGPLCSIESVNGDAFPDMVCHFEDEAANWSPGAGVASLTGVLMDGTAFEGTDSICVVP